jgi:hypothetical protein
MSVPGFNADASLSRMSQRYRMSAAGSAADASGRVSPALVWSGTIFGCSVACAEVCTQFCDLTGWDCCKWETRCGADWDCLRKLLPF